MEVSSKRKVNSAAKQISEQCLGRQARCVGRQLAAIYDESLRPLGLTGSQLTLLVAIALHDNIAPGELSNALSIEKSTLSRNLSRMQASGIIAIETGANNRSQQLHVTPQGSDLLLKALPLWKQAQKKTKQVLGDEGVAALTLAVDSLLKT